MLHNFDYKCLQAFEEPAKLSGPECIVEAIVIKGGLTLPTLNAGSRCYTLVSISVLFVGTLCYWI